MKFSESLKKNKDFQIIYRTGNSLANRSLVMYKKENGLGKNRLGISVSKKVGNSVVRHHLTRLVRESYRLQEEHFKCGYDIVVVVRVSAKEITERHARALLGLDEDKQKKALKKIVKKSLTVAQTEKMLKQDALPKEEKRKVMLKGISKNLKIAINTIHQAVKMVERAGNTAEIQEQETEDDVIITIRLPK